jgi:hypothetical protein
MLQMQEKMLICLHWLSAYEETSRSCKWIHVQISLCTIYTNFRCKPSIIFSFTGDVRHGADIGIF